ncbi:hypothetical protein [Achromobacter dolens]
MQQAARDVHQAKAPPPKKTVPDIPIENIALVGCGGAATGAAGAVD